MKRDSKQLTKRLIELRNAIKRKYKMFKEEIVENYIMLAKQYKPLIKELLKTARPDATVKTELKEEPMDYEETDVEQEDTPTAVSTPKPTRMYEYELETVLSTPEGIESTSRYIDEHFKQPLANKYMNILIREKDKLSIIYTVRDTIMIHIWYGR